MSIKWAKFYLIQNQYIILELRPWIKIIMDRVNRLNRVTYLMSVISAEYSITTLEI